MKLTENPGRRTREGELERAADRLLPPAEVEAASRWIRGRPGYGLRLPTGRADLARDAGVAAVHYQDEGPRFGIGSFKGWGGGYATAALAARHADEAITVSCATDGNHGRAVAWAAREAGVGCVVYLADIVTPLRERKIAELGAETVRSAGNHEVASAECLAASRANGWYVISETENATEERTAGDTLAGYGALWEEALASFGEAPPTHLFVQAGVGGLSAVAAAISRRVFGDRRPVLVVVEAESADCIRRSLEAGERVTVEGRFGTVMAGLAAGAASAHAWDLLRPGADFAVAIGDGAAEAAMARLADPERGAPGGEAALAIEAGASGAAGLAAALEACGRDALRRPLGLDGRSRILTIGTEGPTDPEHFERVVGRPPRGASR